MASDVDPRFDPAFQRGFESTTPRVERAEQVETSPVTPAHVEPIGPSPARNPWFAVLWISAALFTLAGALAQYVATQILLSVTADTAVVEYVIPEVFTALSPVLFAAGLATAIAALVIHALRWQPRD